MSIVDCGFGVGITAPPVHVMCTHCAEWDSYSFTKRRWLQILSCTMNSSVDGVLLRVEDFSFGTGKPAHHHTLLRWRTLSGTTDVKPGWLPDAGCGVT